MDPSPQQTYLYFMYNPDKDSKYLEIDEKLYAKTDALPIDTDRKKAVNLFYTYVLSPLVQKMFEETGKNNDIFFLQNMKFSGLMYNCIKTAGENHEKKNDDFDWNFFSLLYHDNEALSNFCQALINMIEDTRPAFTEMLRDVVDIKNYFHKQLEDFTQNIVRIKFEKNGENMIKVMNKFFGLFINDDFIQIIMRHDPEQIGKIINMKNFEILEKKITLSATGSLSKQLALYLLKTSLFNQLDKFNSKNLINLGFYLYLCHMQYNVLPKLGIKKIPMLDLKKLYYFNIKDGDTKQIMNKTSAISEFFMNKILENNMNHLQKEKHYKYENDSFQIKHADISFYMKDKEKNDPPITYLQKIRRNFHTQHKEIQKKLLNDWYIEVYKLNSEDGKISPKNLNENAIKYKENYQHLFFENHNNNAQYNIKMQDTESQQLFGFIPPIQRSPFRSEMINMYQRKNEDEVDTFDFSQSQSITCKDYYKGDFENNEPVENKLATIDKQLKYEDMESIDDLQFQVYAFIYNLGNVHYDVYQQIQHYNDQIFNKILKGNNVICQMQMILYKLMQFLNDHVQNDETFLMMINAQLQQYMSLFLSTVITMNITKYDDPKYKHIYNGCFFHTNELYFVLDLYYNKATFGKYDSVFQETYVDQIFLTKQVLKNKDQTKNNLEKDVQKYQHKDKYSMLMQQLQILTKNTNIMGLLAKDAGQLFRNVSPDSKNNHYDLIDFIISNFVVSFKKINIKNNETNKMIAKIYDKLYSDLLACQYTIECCFVKVKKQFMERKQQYRTNDHFYKENYDGMKLLQFGSGNGNKTSFVDLVKFDDYNKFAEKFQCQYITYTQQPRERFICNTNGRIQSNPLSDLFIQDEIHIKNILRSRPVGEATQSVDNTNYPFQNTHYDRGGNDQFWKMQLYSYSYPSMYKLLIYNMKPYVLNIKNLSISGIQVKSIKIFQKIKVEDEIPIKTRYYLDIIEIHVFHGEMKIIYIDSQKDMEYQDKTITQIVQKHLNTIQDVKIDCKITVEENFMQISSYDALQLLTRLKNNTYLMEEILTDIINGGNTDKQLMNILPFGDYIKYIQTKQLVESIFDYSLRQFCKTPRFYKESILRHILEYEKKHQYQTYRYMAFNMYNFIDMLQYISQPYSIQIQLEQLQIQEQDMLEYVDYLNDMYTEKFHEEQNDCMSQIEQNGTIEYTKSQMETILKSNNFVETKFRNVLQQNMIEIQSYFRKQENISGLLKGISSKVLQLYGEIKQKSDVLLQQQGAINNNNQKDKEKQKEEEKEIYESTSQQNSEEQSSFYKGISNMLQKFKKPKGKKMQQQRIEQKDPQQLLEDFQQIINDNMNENKVTQIKQGQFNNFQYLYVQVHQDTFQLIDQLICNKNQVNKHIDKLLKKGNTNDLQNINALFMQIQNYVNQFDSLREQLAQMEENDFFFDMNSFVNQQLKKDAIQMMELKENLYKFHSLFQQYFQDLYDVDILKIVEKLQKKMIFLKLQVQKNAFHDVFQVQQFYDIYYGSHTNKTTTTYISYRVFDTYTDDNQNYQQLGLWMKMPQILFKNANINMFYSFTQRNTFINYLSDNHPFLIQIMKIHLQALKEGLDDLDLYKNKGSFKGSNSFQILNALYKGLNGKNSAFYNELIYMLSNDKELQQILDDSDISFQKTYENMNQYFQWKVVQKEMEHMTKNDFIAQNGQWSNQDIIHDDSKGDTLTRKPNKVIPLDDIYNVFNNIFKRAQRIIEERFYNNLEVNNNEQQKKYIVVSENQFNRGDLDEDLECLTNQIYFTRIPMNIPIQQKNEQIIFLNSYENIMNTIISQSNPYNIRFKFDYSQEIANNMNYNKIMKYKAFIQAELRLDQINIGADDYTGQNRDGKQKEKLIGLQSKLNIVNNLGNQFQIYGIDDPQIQITASMMQQKQWLNQCYTSYYVMKNENILFKMILQAEFLMINKIFILSQNLPKGFQQQQEIDYKKNLMQILRICQYITMKSVYPAQKIAMLYYLQESFSQNIKKINNYFQLYVYYSLFKLNNFKESTEINANDIFDKKKFKMNFHFQIDQLKNFIDIIQNNQYEQQKNEDIRIVFGQTIKVANLSQPDIVQAVIKVFDLMHNNMKNGVFYGNKILMIIYNYLFKNTDQKMIFNIKLHDSDNEIILKSGIDPSQVELVSSQYGGTIKQYDISIRQDDQYEPQKINIYTNQLGQFIKITDNELNTICGVSTNKINKKEYDMWDVIRDIQGNEQGNQGCMYQQLIIYQLGSINYINTIIVSSKQDNPPQEVLRQITLGLTDKHDYMQSINNLIRNKHQFIDLLMFANQYQQYGLLYLLQNFKEYKQYQYDETVQKVKTGYLVGKLGGISSNFNEDLEELDLIHIKNIKNLLYSDNTCDLYLKTGTLFGQTKIQEQLQILVDPSIVDQSFVYVSQLFQSKYFSFWYSTEDDNENTSKQDKSNIDTDSPKFSASKQPIDQAQSFTQQTTKNEITQYQEGEKQSDNKQEVSQTLQEEQQKKKVNKQIPHSIELKKPEMTTIFNSINTPNPYSQDQKKYLKDFIQDMSNFIYEDKKWQIFHKNNVDELLNIHLPMPKLSMNDVQNNIFDQNSTHQTQFRQIPTGQGKSAKLLPYFASQMPDDVIMLTLDNLVKQNLNDLSTPMLLNTSYVIAINDDNMMHYMSSKNRKQREKYILCIQHFEGDNQDDNVVQQVQYLKQCREIFKEDENVLQWVKLQQYNQTIKLISTKNSTEHEKNLISNYFICEKKYILVCGYKQYLKFLFQEYRDQFITQYDAMVYTKGYNNQSIHMKEYLNQVFLQNIDYLEQRSVKQENDNDINRFLKTVIMYMKAQKKYCYLLDEFHSIFSNDTIFKYIEQTDSKYLEIQNIEEEFEKIKEILMYDERSGNFRLIEDKMKQYMDNKVISQNKKELIEKQINNFSKMQLNINIGYHDLIQKEQRCTDDDTFDDMQSLILARPLNQGLIQCKSFFDCYLSQLLFSYMMYIQIAHKTIKYFKGLNHWELQKYIQTTEEKKGLVQNQLKTQIEQGFDITQRQNHVNMPVQIPYYQTKFEYMNNDGFSLSMNEKLKLKIETDIRNVLKQKYSTLNEEKKQISDKDIQLSSLLITIIGDQLFNQLKTQLSKFKVTLSLDKICQMICGDIKKQIPRKNSKTYEVNQYDLFLNITNTSHFQYAISGTTTTATFDIEEIIKDIQISKISFIKYNPLIDSALNGRRNFLSNTYIDSKGYHSALPLNIGALQDQIQIFRNKTKFQKNDKTQINAIIDRYFADYPHMVFFKEIQQDLDEIYGLTINQFTDLLQNYIQDSIQISGDGVDNKQQNIIAQKIKYIDVDLHYGQNKQKKDDEQLKIPEQQDKENHYTQIFHILPDQNGLLQNIQDIQPSLNNLDARTKNYFKIVIVYDTKQNKDYDYFINIKGKYYNKYEISKFKVFYGHKDMQNSQILSQVEDERIAEFWQCFETQLALHDMRKLYDFINFIDLVNSEEKKFRKICITQGDNGEEFTDCNGIQGKVLMIFRMSRTTGFDIQNQHNFVHSVCSIINTNKGLHSRTNIKQWLQGVGRCRTVDQQTPIFTYLYKNQMHAIQPGIYERKPDEKLYISKNLNSTAVDIQQFGKSLDLRLQQGQVKGQIFNQQQLNVSVLGIGSTVMEYAYINEDYKISATLSIPGQLLIEDYRKRVDFYAYLINNEIEYNENPMHYQLFAKSILKSTFRNEEIIEFTDYKYFHDKDWKDSGENNMKFSILGKDFMDKDKNFVNIKFWSDNWTKGKTEGLVQVQQMQMQQTQQQIQQQQQQMAQRQQQQQQQLQQVMQDMFKEHFQYDYDSGFLRYDFHLFQGLNTNYKYISSIDKQMSLILPFYKKTIVKCFQDNREMNKVIDAINIYDKIINLLSEQEYSGISVDIWE